MKKKISGTLKKWKQEEQDRTALLIDGARRVGKSRVDPATIGSALPNLFINFSELETAGKCVWWVKRQATTHRKQLQRISLNTLHQVSIRFLRKATKSFSPVPCQIQSDTLGRKIQTIENPQNVGAVNTSIIASLGLGIYHCAQEATQAIPMRPL